MLGGVVASSGKKGILAPEKILERKNPES